MKLRLNHTVFIISAGRPETVTSHRVFPYAKIAVPESQRRAYERAGYGCEIIGVPDREDGNCAKKKNWCLRNSPTDRLICVDDDYLYMGYIERRETRRAQPWEIAGFCNNAFDMCEQISTVFWGVNQQFDPRFYREYSPISLLSPVLGPFQGMIRTDLRFDERIWLKEDYDYSLQVLNRCRKVLRFNKWHYCVNHISKAGGIVAKRTWEVEREHMELLRRKWGGRIVAFTRKGRESINPIVRWPVPGI